MHGIYTPNAVYYAIMIHISALLINFQLPQGLPYVALHDNNTNADAISDNHAGKLHNGRCDKEKYFSSVLDGN